MTNSAKREKNDFSAGKIIVSLNKRCSYPHVSLRRERSVFYDLEVEYIETLMRPSKKDKDTDVGVILLVHLTNKQPEHVEAVIRQLENKPCVVSAEADYILESHNIPNDRYFRYLWGMDNIHAPSAWNFSTGSGRVRVAVIDSGVDFDHPDIAPNLAAALDARSTDMTMGGSYAGDETGHGTHVAGTLGAVGNNILGVAGVCWTISLISLKIGDTMLDLAAAIKAIDYASRRGIEVLNASFGGYFYSKNLELAIDDYEGLFVASAGNDGSDNDIFPVFPSSYPSRNILSVASIDENGALSAFSNYGRASVDIAAPGRDILSTDIFSRYSYMSGTSMAAPHIAGAAALIKSFRPSLTALEIKDIILSTVDRSPPLVAKLVSGGTLNLQRAIEGLL